MNARRVNAAPNASKRCAGLLTGVVSGVSAAVIDASLPGVAQGDCVVIESGDGRVRGVVRAVRAHECTVLPYGSTAGISAGNAVRAAALGDRSDALAVLGRFLRVEECAATAAPAAQCRASATPFWTGIRAIDGLLTFARGARVGIFGEPGTGKSRLLERLARSDAADAVVVCLCGERGREAAEWRARVDPRTAVICATSDRSAGERIAAVHHAAHVAARLRDRGLHVLWILDSVARFAYALREVATGCGEPVGRGGYPASVFSDLARMVESAGETRSGSVTLVASVLADGADGRDPVSEGARSLLDGHIALDGALARAGRFPAIDVLASASRTMERVVTSRHLQAAASIRGALALLQRTAEARSLGLPAVGDDAGRAIAAEPSLESYLRQGEDFTNPAAAVEALTALADTLEERSWISAPT